MNKLKKIFIFLVFSYIYIPIFMLIINSFNLDRYGISWKGFSLKWYQALWNNHSLIDAALHSVYVAFFAACCATIIGTMTAIALYRYRFKGKKFVGSMLFIVMMSPDIVMAVSLLALFLIINIKLGFISLLIAHITFCLPYVVISVLSRLKGFDVRMLEAAKDLGASEITILHKIIFPLAMPAIISSWLLAFTISLDDVVVSSFVTGIDFEVLPVKIFSLVKTGVSPEVNALASIMILLSLVLIIASQLINRKFKH